MKSYKVNWIRFILVITAIVLTFTLGIHYIRYIIAEDAKETIAVMSEVTPTPTLPPMPSPTPIFDLTPLKADIETYLNKFSGEKQVYIENLNTGVSFSINSRPLKAVSVMKLFNMVAYYSELQNGNLTANESTRQTLMAMIEVSDNNANTELLKVIGNGNSTQGITKVNNFCKQYGLNDTSQNHLLYDEVPQGVVFTGSNRTSAVDCGKVLRQIYNGDCISQEYSQQMLNLLLSQTKNGKIPLHLPTAVRVAHKTGEAQGVSHDVGIVFGEETDYVICVLTRNVPNSDGVIAEVSRMTYNYLNK